MKVVVLDLNDTLTLLNDVDPDKPISVVILQLVAQNIYIESTVPLETYIKSVILDKKEQRRTYGNLIEYAAGLVEKRLLDKSQYDMIEPLREKFENHWKMAVCKNNGFFDSMFVLLDYIRQYCPTTCIIVQSFGNEIPKFFEQIRARYPDWYVNDTILDFDKYDTFDEIVEAAKRYIVPGCIAAFHNSYQKWRCGMMGKLLFYGKNVDTIFFDDNAHMCGTMVRYDVEDAENKTKILQVNTGLALTDGNYLLDFFRCQ